MKNLILFTLMLAASVCYPQEWQKAAINNFNYFMSCVDTNDIIYAANSYDVYASSDYGEHWQTVQRFQHEADLDVKIHKIFINGKNELVIHYKDSLYICSNSGRTIIDKDYYSRPDDFYQYIVDGFNKDIFVNKASGVYSADGGHTIVYYDYTDTLFTFLKYIDIFGNLYSSTESGKTYKWRLDDSVITVSIIPSHVNSKGHAAVYERVIYGYGEWYWKCRYFIGSEFQDYVDINGDSTIVSLYPLWDYYDENLFIHQDGLYRSRLDSIPDFYTDSLGGKHAKYFSTLERLTDKFNLQNPIGALVKTKDGLMFGLAYDQNASKNFSFSSEDDGYTWNNVDCKFNQSAVNAIWPNYIDGNVYFGTNGGGLYKGSDINSLTYDDAFGRYNPGADIKKFIYNGDYMFMLANIPGEGTLLLRKKKVQNYDEEFDVLELNGLKPDLIAASKSMLAITVNHNSVYVSTLGTSFVKLVDPDILFGDDLFKYNFAIKGLCVIDEEVYISLTGQSVWGERNLVIKILSEGNIASVDTLKENDCFSTFLKDKKGNIYAGGEFKGLYKRSSQTAKWGKLALNANKTYALALDSVNVLYAAVLTQTADMKYSAIYYSTDGGYGWKLFGTPIDSVSINQPDSVLAVINDIAATKTSVYVSTNENIYMAPSIGYLINVEDDRPPVAKEFSLSQNYPNPFNPSTIISYDIPEAAEVTLKVYDLLGREVADLVNEYKEAGRYNVTFDASHLSTGIYIYQLRANEYVSVKKMSFVK